MFNKSHEFYGRLNRKKFYFSNQSFLTANQGCGNKEKIQNFSLIALKLCVLGEKTHGHGHG